MKTKLIFIAAGLGMLAALYSAFVYSQRPKAQPPAFQPAANPFDNGIYANGIIESVQASGSNINMYPEVTGPITAVYVKEGQTIKAGQPLLMLDDSVQRATAAQQHAAADAASALLEELKSQPRPENLEVARTQVENAQATLKSMQDHLDKEQVAYKNAISVTLDDLDNARNAVAIARTAMAVAEKQYALVKAGAWSYDIRNQEMLAKSLEKAAAAADALLSKYTLKAPCDGVVLSIEANVGSYVSPQGSYGTYTQGFNPLVVVGTPQDYLAVRCYVDEILVHRLPVGSNMSAKMFVRGTTISIPMTFDHMQPYISPKIELADQRQERVDVRVLPVVFKFPRPKEVNIYPGQLVDVYIGTTSGATNSSKK